METEYNLIIELYKALGCDLSVTPETWKQVSMIGFQFLGASGFLWWFVKMLFSIVKEAFRGRV